MDPVGSRLIVFASMIKSSQVNSGIFIHANINKPIQMIPLSILSDKMTSGVSLAMYIILSVLHRNMLDVIRQFESQQVQVT